MARIAYLLLAHQAPERVIAQAEALAVGGDWVAIHYDTKAPEAEWAVLQEALAGHARVVFAPRLRCGWGDWSLVEATLALIRTAQEAFSGATHYYLISGDCYPIKPRAALERALAAPCDWIEAVDFFDGGWIRTGMTEDRVLYRHWVNERAHHAWFYRLLDWQKRLGLRRRLPEGLALRIGAQWWLLRAETVAAVMARVAARPDLVRFFRRTWIPDEIFFQSLVADLVPARQIRSRPTHLIFSDYGKPVVFYDDHAGYLAAQEGFFARKISPDAEALRAQLLAGYAGEGFAPRAAADYHATVAKGRVGARFQPRFWARAITIPKEARIWIVAASGAEGRAAMVALAEQLGAPGYAEPFAGGAWDLGGLERDPLALLRHRRAVINLLRQDHRDLVLQLAPEATDVMADLAGSGCELRIFARGRDAAALKAEFGALVQRWDEIGEGVR